MLISLLLAWMATIFALLAALKFIARISGNRPLNRAFSRCHIPFGVLLLVTGVLHGILAGNPSWATLADFQPAAVLFTWNWGTVCLVLSIALAATYLLRRKLRRHWMPAHRVLTVALIACLVLHLCSVGIQLPERLLGTQETAQTAVAAEDSSASGTSGSASDSAAGTAETSGASGVVTFSGAQLKDGTYQGSADGYEGTITVTVTVSGGQVSDITVDSESDTPQYFSRAESLLDTIQSEQSLEVDAVTGATFSSAGLINAVADALQGAVTSGTLQVTNIDLSSIQRHGH